MTWKRVLGGVGIVVLIGGFAVFRMGHADRHVWAQTLDDVAAERAALFALRDEVGVDEALQAQLRDWASRLGHESLEHPGTPWRKQTLLRSPVLSGRTRTYVNQVAPYAAELDGILRSGAVHLATWVHLEESATPAEMIQVHEGPMLPLPHVARYWHIVGLTSSDPEPALRALDRLVAPAGLPVVSFRTWWVLSVSLAMRDALYLGLILRGRLTRARLDLWLAERRSVREHFADAIRVRRAFYTGPRLALALRDDQDHVVDRLRKRPKDAAKKWWYARSRGARDANWIIRRSVAWERYSRGLAGPPPNGAKDWERAWKGRYVDRYGLGGAMHAGVAYARATAHRNARLLGAALFTRSAGEPLWNDDASFRKALGDRANELDGGIDSFASVYRVASDGGIGGLGVPADADLPAYLEPNRGGYCAHEWWRWGNGDVRMHQGNVAVCLPE